MHLEQYKELELDVPPQVPDWYLPASQLMFQFRQGWQVFSFWLPLPLQLDPNRYWPALHTGQSQLWLHGFRSLVVMHLR